LKDTASLFVSEALKMQATEYFNHTGHFLRLIDFPKIFAHSLFVVFLGVSSIRPTSCDGFYLCKTCLFYHFLV